MKRPTARRPSLPDLRRGLAQLFLPSLCPLCTRHEPLAGNRFCADCARDMLRAEPPWCPICCLPYSGVGPPHPCHRCRHDPPPFTAIRVWGVYRGALARSIHRFKYAGQLALRRALQEMAVETFCDTLREVPLAAVIPVPCHPRTLHQRGTDLPALLARAVSRTAGRPYLPQALAKRRATPDLVGLGAAARAQAVADAFTAQTDLAGDVLLVDDVVTSTATARACAVACRSAGAARVWLLALARTPEKLHDH